MGKVANSAEMLIPGKRELAVLRAGSRQALQTCDAMPKAPGSFAVISGHSRGGEGLHLKSVGRSSLACPAQPQV